MTDSEGKRFTDEELHEFHEQFEAHVQHEKQDRQELLECLQANKTALQELAEDTKDLREAWHAAEGAVKVGAFMGRLFVWATGVVGVSWAIMEILRHSDKVK